MKTYEMVERIIELTEKGKIKWQIGRWYTGRYKGILIERCQTEWPNKIRINGVAVSISDNALLARFDKAIERIISELWEAKRAKEKIKEDKRDEKKLREAGDILKG